jgi:hypothetical protein
MTEHYEQIFSDQCNDYSIIVEDDSKVCYAYLLLKASMIGDVWLYNQSEAPSKTEWKKEEMPFLNPIEFLKEGKAVFPITRTEEIKVEWLFLENTCSLKQARIFIRGEHTVTIKPGSKPGWSSHVKKNGPLANILNDD